jgi:hypothetical protein
MTVMFSLPSSSWRRSALYRSADVWEWTGFEHHAMPLALRAALHRRSDLLNTSKLPVKGDGKSKVVDTYSHRY